MPGTSTDSVTMDNLIVGEFPIVRDTATIDVNQTLTRGCVLGKITATGYYLALDDTAVDGSAVFQCVLLEDVTTTSATQVASVALTGEFDAATLTFGGTTTAADMKVEMRMASCFQKTLSDNVVGE